MSDLIDWGYLTELYRETDKPIRKDENVFYEFSSAMFANFKHILKERDAQAKRIAELSKLCDSQSILLGHASNTMKELEARLAQVEGDAERYREKKVNDSDQTWQTRGGFTTRNFKRDIISCGDSVVPAIDAAKEQTNG